MQTIGELLVIIAFLNLVIQFIATYIVHPLYKKYDWFKGYYHDVCGYHIPDEDTILVCRHGFENHAICKICGKGIGQDIGGDWV